MMLYKDISRIICILFLCLFATMQCHNLATDSSIVATIKDSGNNDNTTANFFGYSITLGPDTLDVGSPLTSSPNKTKEGKILSCPTRKLFQHQSSTTFCTDITPPFVQPGDAFGQTVQNSISDLVTCSATKKQECTQVNYNPGYCYRSLDNGSSWQADPKTSRADCSQKLDIMFVLDGSGSIGKENFEIVKNWTIELASFFNIATQAAQIGVVQYSYYNSRKPRLNQIKTEVALGECRNQRCFRKKVSRIKLFASQTFTAHAINKTVSDFKTSIRFFSSLTSKVMILLTDGKSSDPEYIAPSADYARSYGITTFAIGVGDKIEESELQVIANGGSSNKRVYNVVDFQKLQTIVGELKSEILKLALEGGGNALSVFYGQEMGETGFSIAQSNAWKDQEIWKIEENDTDTMTIPKTGVLQTQNFGRNLPVYKVQRLRSPGIAAYMDQPL